MKTILRSASVLAFLAAALAASAQVNLVNNPGFETGDFTGYTVTNPDGFTFVRDANSYGAENIDQGTYSAFTGAQNVAATISQAIPTTAGRRYTVSFDLRTDVSNLALNSPNSFLATFGGATLLSLVNAPASGGFVPYSFSVVGTGSDTLVFAARNAPNYYVLDNLSVVAATPEPSAFAALGLGALALLRRRK